MEFALLIYADPAGPEKLSPSQATEMLNAYAGYTGALQSAGVLQRSNRLRPAHTATTVRVKSGKTEVLKGPYAEAREQLSGYYLIDVKDLDEALSWATKCPGVNHGIVEVRPIWPRSEF